MTGYVMAAERLQKILARTGFGSRRGAEDMIRAGEVTINGRVAKLGDQADVEKDAIKVRGKLLTRKPSAPFYLMFHKPKGVICMMHKDPEGRKTLLDYLGSIPERLFPVGRLDYNTEGLLLLTNDGEASERILKHTGLIRGYKIKVKGHPTDGQLDELRKGARLEGRLVKPHAVRAVEKLTSKAHIEISFIGMGSGDIREYMQYKRFLVEKVVRTRIGQLTIEKLPLGAVLVLRPSQVKALIDQPELGVRAVDAAETTTSSKSVIRNVHKPKETLQASGSIVPDAPVVPQRAPKPHKPARPNTGASSSRPPAPVSKKTHGPKGPRRDERPRDSKRRDKGPKGPKAGRRTRSGAEIY